MTNLLDAGWDEMAKTAAEQSMRGAAAPAAQHQAAMDDYEKADRMRRLFTTADGRQVLQHLRELTVEQTTFNPDRAADLNPAYYGFWRDGQNSVVRWIMEQIAKAEAGPPMPPAAMERNDNAGEV